GAYLKGSDPELDEAISKKKDMENFLIQNSMNKSEFDETVNSLLKLMSSS
ncbi:MAG: flagellum-specific synthase, partial [Campylobacterota bacterium]|nr:flagellum-specific synthase [Campylobacterota bacterium]